MKPYLEVACWLMVIASTFMCGVSSQDFRQCRRREQHCKGPLGDTLGFGVLALIFIAAIFFIHNK